jgi:pyridoxal phosphate enzyme (YggS family)
LTFKDRLDAVRRRIASACERAGRDPQSVTIIAVTKVFPASAIREAYDAGLRDFGENYVQEFEGKYPEVTGLDGARFHFIGHLQSNKTRKAADIFEIIQTVDTPKLARRLNEAGKPLEIMVEVKLSEEQSKSGAAPGDLPALISAIRDCPNLNLTGLMTMPPWSDDPEPSRPYFVKLRSLARQHGLAAISMGMSHDLETAVEEGATHVRIGTALFGPRKKKQ